MLHGLEPRHLSSGGRLPCGGLLSIWLREFHTSSPPSKLLECDAAQIITGGEFHVVDSRFT
jgi:hypothetical protein